MADRSLALLAKDIAAKYVPGVGAPSRIREVDTVAKLLGAIEDGMTVEDAAELVGISRDAIHDWKTKGTAGIEPYKLFSEAYKRAGHRFEQKHLQRVSVAGEEPRFWTASAWLLERTRPEKYGQRREDSSGPKVIVQVGIKDSDVTFACSTQQVTEKSTG